MARGFIARSAKKEAGRQGRRRERYRLSMCDGGQRTEVGGRKQRIDITSSTLEVMEESAMAKTAAKKKTSSKSKSKAAPKARGTASKSKKSTATKSKSKSSSRKRASKKGVVAKVAGSIASAVASVIPGGKKKK